MTGEVLILLRATNTAELVTLARGRKEKVKFFLRGQSLPLAAFCKFMCRCNMLSEWGTEETSAGINPNVMTTACNTLRPAVLIWIQTEGWLHKSIWWWWWRWWLWGCLGLCTIQSFNYSIQSSKSCISVILLVLYLWNLIIFHFFTLRTPVRCMHFQHMLTLKSQKSTNVKKSKSEITFVFLFYLFIPFRMKKQLLSFIDAHKKLNSDRFFLFRLPEWIESLHNWIIHRPLYSLQWHQRTQRCFLM